MTSAVRIYHPAVPGGYEWVLPTDAADFDLINRLGERSPSAPWTPLRFKLLKQDDRGQPLMRADLPWLGENVLVLRDAAIEAVGKCLQPHGELLPLECDDARLVLFSAPVKTGVLDESRSHLERFDSGRIMALRSPTFRLPALQGVAAFKLAEMPRGDLFLEGALVADIVATGLSAGTDFVLA